MSKPALMGKFALLLMLCIPRPASAQFEIGIDAGLRYERIVGISRSTFQVPSEWLRVGFRSGRFGAESLINFMRQRTGGGVLTQLEFIPGLSYYLYRNYYVRGEGGMILTTLPYASSSQFGYGLAVGANYPLGAKPFYIRLETAIHTWVENQDHFEKKDFRALVGLSLMLN